MAVTVGSGVLQGVDAVPVGVEVDLLRRLPAVCIVGLAASAVKESGERIRSAIEAIGEEFPRKRVVVNLAPADLRKEGTSLDLPIALGILAAAGIVPAESVDGILAVGELALGGQLRGLRGVMAMALLARSQGKTLVVPREAATAAAIVPGVAVVGADDLGEVVRWLRGEQELGVEPPNAARAPSSGLDLSDVRGQELARRALEIAAAGAHHLLLIGPPGCGKSMLARRLPTILPELTFAEALEATRVHDAANLLDGQALLSERPFRAPHHSVTVAGLVGDATLRPGEISLAHHGVLFLDEAPEFQRAALEVLRQPLEEGSLRLSRARGTLELPASLTLVMASNPCPCGRRGHGTCKCPDGDVHRYLRRLSGPLLDRVDLCVQLSAVPPRTLVTSPPGESSARVLERVEEARRRQHRRGQTVPNGRLPTPELERHARLTDAARDQLVQGVDTYELSGRGFTRVLRVALTLADLDGAGRVHDRHVLEALVHRPPAGL